MLKRQWNRMLVVGKGNPKTSLAIFVSLLVLLVIPSLASAGCKYVDPRQSASGYQNWCKCIGGTPYWKGGNLACTPPKGGGQSSPAGDDPLLQGAKELGESLHKLLFDDPQEKARQKESQEQVLRSLDEMSRNRMGSEDEMLRNAAEKARQLDKIGRASCRERV